ncbi:MAG TPA: hypothetical protein DCL41_08345, partial [Bdellovibrionales bacterium]|nr:hypothetical protein [Bdellovibrionales bacterium]
QPGFTFKVLKSTPHPIYKQTGSAEYDVAVLTIDNQGITYPSLPLVHDLRSIPWEFNKEFFAMSTVGSIIGYPGDRLLGTMWYVACFLKQEISDINRIHYDCDTFGGMSGSPILVNLNNRPTIIGVHTNGGRDNSGLMLRPEILNFILNP